MKQIYVSRITYAALFFRINLTSITFFRHKYCYRIPSERLVVLLTYNFHNRTVMLKKVLIVEDYADVRAIMKILVRRYGYEVIEARDGYDAILKAKEFNPDLILMDLAMPVMDGVTATKLLRSLDEFSDVPIIALSAYGDSWRNEAIRAGINQVICKPLDFDSLQPLLTQYLH